MDWIIVGVFGTLPVANGTWNLASKVIVVRSCFCNCLLASAFDVALMLA